MRRILGTRRKLEPVKFLCKAMYLFINALYLFSPQFPIIFLLETVSRYPPPTVNLYLK